MLRQLRSRRTQAGVIQDNRFLQPLRTPEDLRVTVTLRNEKANVAWQTKTFDTIGESTKWLR